MCDDNDVINDNKEEPNGRSLVLAIAHLYQFEESFQYSA